MLDDPERVGILAQLGVEDAAMVQPVNPDPSMNMDDVVVFHDDAYMVDDPLRAVKERKVTGLAFFNKTKWDALSGLFGSRSFKLFSTAFVDHLGKASCIESEWGSAALHLRTVKIEQGSAYQRVFSLIFPV